MTETTQINTEYRPRRSVLYVPGSRQKALEKTKTLAVDSIIFDLEGAVAPDAKPAARETIEKMLSGGGYGQRERVVRINGLDTPWGGDDLKMALRCAPEAVLLPKVNAPAQIEEIDALLSRSGAPDSMRIWAMMETPRGVLHAEQIAAASPRLEAFIFGSNDLVKELNAEHTPNRLSERTAIGLCLLAARAYGLVCVDGVFNAYKDQEGFRAACKQSKEIGFDGRTLLHPSQVEIANEVFAPTADEVKRAKRVVAAYEDAVAKGQGVGVVDGEIVEDLHADFARQRILMAEKIAEMHGG